MYDVNDVIRDVKRQCEKSMYVIDQIMASLSRYDITIQICLHYPNMEIQSEYPNLMPSSKYGIVIQMFDYPNMTPIPKYVIPTKYGTTVQIWYRYPNIVVDTPRQPVQLDNTVQNLENQERILQN